MVYVPQFGYTPNVAATEGYCASLAFPRVADTPLMATRSEAPLEVQLWAALLKCVPTYRRGAQGIGDCASWGTEFGVTVLMAIDAILGKTEWIAEAATEAIYGGMRVEADGGRLGGYSDGSYCAAGAQWLHNWGVLLRINYAEQTGIAEHDLRKYSSSKAKEWGNYGCGGKNDAGREDGKLDLIARQFPLKDVSRVLHVDELDVAISNGKPVPVGSGVGYGNMRRNAEGVVRASGSWSHLMCFAGLRRIKGLTTPGILGAPARPRRLFREIQSWGNSCTGPDPDIADEAISQCSWWVEESDAQKQLDGRDAFAFSTVEGFPPARIDWDAILSALDWRGHETAVG